MITPAGSPRRDDTSRRRHSKRLLEFCGRSLYLHEWAKELGISAKLISGRLVKGWTVEESLTIPVGSRRENREVQRKAQRGLIEFDGRSMYVSEWAEEYDLPPKLLSGRLGKGWAIERALTTPVQKCASPSGEVEYAGKTQSITKWAEETGVPMKQISQRLRRGWSVEEALTTPVRKAKK